MSILFWWQTIMWEMSETEIRTPSPPDAPRINGPSVFGVRPGSEFLYKIPVTGERPMSYSAEGLPQGLCVDTATGRITGTVEIPGESDVALRVKNSWGAAEKPFRIVCGERISLTPTMGWNSWNCWGSTVDQEKVLKSARALVTSGLADHGWANVHIDDGWQGRRDPETHAMQPNEGFPDMKALCDEIHEMGLRVGIYSTPWITSYGGFPGASSDDPVGGWKKRDDYESEKRFGEYSFIRQDAKQWAEWGIDYLKYDWDPNDIAHTREVHEALRGTDRDITLSLSCAMPFEQAAEFSKYANSWRTTGDIWDTWDVSGAYQWSVSEIGFSQDRWTPYGGPGHFNDVDMLVLGWVGWGAEQHLTKLTPAEQYTHMALWCLLGSPLLLGCDLERLDPFTLNLLTNDEVLAVNQDPLGKQARRVATIGDVDVFRKELVDGATAYGFFNRGDSNKTVVAKMDRIGSVGPHRVRDLWRHKDLPDAAGDLEIKVESHSVELYRLLPTRSSVS